MKKSEVEKKAVAVVEKVEVEKKPTEVKKKKVEKTVSKTNVVKADRLPDFEAMMSLLVSEGIRFVRITKGGQRRIGGQSTVYVNKAKIAVYASDVDFENICKQFKITPEDKKDVTDNLGNMFTQNGNNAQYFAGKDKTHLRDHLVEIKNTASVELLIKALRMNELNLNGVM